MKITSVIQITNMAKKYGYTKTHAGNGSHYYEYRIPMSFGDTIRIRFSDHSLGCDWTGRLQTAGCVADIEPWQELDLTKDILELIFRFPENADDTAYFGKTEAEIRAEQLDYERAFSEASPDATPETLLEVFKKKRVGRNIDMNFLKFFNAFLEAALISEATEDGTPLSDNYDRDDIDEPTLETLKARARDWWIQNENLLLAIERTNGRFTQFGYTYDRALGHDLWLTMNRHGAGFWHRKEVYVDYGNIDYSDVFAASAEKLGEIDLHVTCDNKIHGS